MHHTTQLQCSLTVCDLHNVSPCCTRSLSTCSTTNVSRQKLSHLAITTWSWHADLWSPASPTCFTSSASDARSSLSKSSPSRSMFLMEKCKLIWPTFVSTVDKTSAKESLITIEWFHFGFFLFERHKRKTSHTLNTVLDPHMLEDITHRRHSDGSKMIGLWLIMPRRFFLNLIQFFLHFRENRLQWQREFWRQFGITVQPR